MAAPQKYAHIDFTPPAGARREAEQGLKLRREHGRGGTAVGIARARDIANGVKLSPSTVRRMKAFFDRHASDSKAEGFRRGEKGWPSNGVIANKLWGGPAGYSWAKKVVAQMEAADARSTYSLDAEASTIETGTDRRSAVIPNVERRFLGNFSEAEASDPDLLKVEERADPETGKKRTYLVGYAARFGKNSLLLGDFVERIAPSAFEIVEKRQDADGKPLETRCLFNHSPDNLLGRFPTTMRMWVDERGLRYECLLPETRKDIAELVARGDLKGSSFSFVVAEGGEKWTTEEGRSTRLVTRIKSLLDCGPVTYPAYDSATVAVAKRSYDQFVASKSPKAVVEKRDSGIATRAAEEARKTEAFLAERRKFCPTGEGGGIDNSCGGEGGGGSAKESPKKDSGRTVSSAVKGALAGAAAGALGGGLPGAIIGAVALGFAAYVAGGKKTDEALEKAKSDMGIDDDKLNVATAAVFAKGKPQDIKTKVTKDGVIAMHGREGQVFISSKPPYFGIKGKSNLHFNPNGGGAEVAKDAELAAKSVGVKTVTVQSWTDESDKALKAAGFKPTGVSDSEDHDLWIKDLSRKGSKRDIAELHAFLAERRAFCPTGPGGGVDNSCGSKGDSGGAAVSREPGIAKEVTNAISGGVNTALLAGMGGAAAGAAAGPAATVAGAVAGAVIGIAGTVASAMSMTSKAAKKVYDAIEKVGTSEKKLDEAAKTLGVHMTVTAGENGSVVAESGNGFKIEFQKYGKDEVGPKNAGLYAHVSNPGGAIGGKGTESAGRLASTLVKAARQAGANHVTVKVDKGDPQTADQFEKSGYTAINAGSHWMMYRKIGASRRSYDELHAFLAERRGFCATGTGGGIDNSCGGKEMSAPDSGGGTGGGTVFPKPGPSPDGGQKSLEQQRLEAAGKWDKDLSHKENIAINTPYDGGDNGGFVPDYHREVTIPGTNQKTRINVDDQEHVSQFIGLAAKAAGMTPEDYMKSRRMNGTPQKASPEDKAKLFGGTQKQYVSKIKRSGGWGNKEFDDTAKRIGSTLRAAGIKGETLSHAVREHAKATGRDPKDEMYSGLKTYQRDPGEFMVWAKKRLDHYYANAKRSLEAFLAERRGFCPTGEGGGIDNSCNAGGGGKGKGDGGKGGASKKTPPDDGGKSPMLGKMLDKIDKLAKDAKTPGGTSTGGKSSVLGKMIDRIANGEKGSGGSQSPKSGSGEKYKKPDDEDTDWLGRKTGKGPNWLGIDPKKTMEKIVESGGKVDGPGLSSPKKSEGGKGEIKRVPVSKLEALAFKKKQATDPHGLQAKKDGKYLEWKKGKDQKSQEKTKDAQEFIDKAREGQLARGGKDKGKSDDGGGVQTWSKGDHFPWTAKQVGTDKGYVQGQHPDGSKTAKYPFDGDSSEAHRKVYEEIKSKKKDKRSVTLSEMTAFLTDRRAFCPTGDGGGLDNSCPGGKGDGSSGGKPTGGGKGLSGGGSTGPKGGGEKYKKPDDEDTDWLGRKTGKGPNWLGIDTKEIAKKVADSGGKSDGQSAGFKVHPKMGYDSGKPKGDYKEWEKGKDHLDKSKEKDAQAFLDRAREGQLARGGKNGGKSDDGGGVQTWSKGEHYPWTVKQVGHDSGHVQGVHPDGSKTEKYPFENGDTSDALRKVSDEIKSKKKDKRSVTLSEMTAFLLERAG